MDVTEVTFRGVTLFMVFSWCCHESDQEGVVGCRLRCSPSFSQNFQVSQQATTSSFESQVYVAGPIHRFTSTQCQKAASVMASWNKASLITWKSWPLTDSKQTEPLSPVTRRAELTVGEENTTMFDFFFFIIHSVALIVFGHSCDILCHNPIQEIQKVMILYKRNIIHSVFHSVIRQLFQRQSLY